MSARGGFEVDSLTVTDIKLKNVKLDNYQAHALCLYPILQGINFITFFKLPNLGPKSVT